MDLIKGGMISSPVNLRQPPKAFCPKVLSVEGSNNVPAKLLHSAKADSPMNTRFEGSVNDFKLVQRIKAASPIESTDEGITMEVRLLQL